MIIDTTYLLRLSRVGINTDLLGGIEEGKVPLSFEDICVNSISLFELQAKAAKLKLPPKLAIDAINVINSDFRVEPFYNPKIIKIASLLSGEFSDYIDCIILATAIVLKEDLVTEDTRINAKRKMIAERYGIKTVSYKELVRKTK